MKRLDLSLITFFAVISLIGLLTLAGIGDTTSFFKKQVVWHLAGCVLLFAIFSVKQRFFREWTWFIYLGALVGLIAVFIIGKVGKGAQRWIAIGPVHVQPSEFAKIALCLALADVLSHFTEKGKIPLGFVESFVVFLVVLPLFVFTVLQPDLGTALIFVLVVFSMVLVVGVKKRVLIVILLLSVVVGIGGWKYLKPYQKRRVIAFINPRSDPYGAGYHVIQSRIAIGSGRLFGKGYMKGTQSRYKFIPEKHTDFIYSTFAEDWGFIGSLVLFILYFFFLSRIIEIVKKANSLYGFYAIIGLGSIFFWHIFINIGMTMGLLPVVGVPLPFMSYGGSSVVASYINIGLILNFASGR